MSWPDHHRVLSSWPPAASRARDILVADARNASSATLPVGPAGPRLPWPLRSPSTTLTFFQHTDDVALLDAQLACQPGRFSLFFEKKSCNEQSPTCLRRNVVKGRSHFAVRHCQTRRSIATRKPGKRGSGRPRGPSRARIAPTFGSVLLVPDTPPHSTAWRFAN
jgi:hypothetical protein